MSLPDFLYVKKMKNTQSIFFMKSLIFTMEVFFLYINFL